MKFYSRLKLYKASNVTFSAEKCEAYSYGWWKFVKAVNGKVVFNWYTYSNSTSKHQRKVHSQMIDLGMKPDLIIETHYDLDGRARHGQGTNPKEAYIDAIENLYIKIFTLQIKLPRMRGDNAYSLERLVEYKKTIPKAEKILGVHISLKRQKELLKKCVADDEYNRKQSRERSQLAKAKKQKRDVLFNSLTEQGFAPWIDYRGEVRLKCEQCEAVAINGFATHEQGCPNIVRKLHAVENDESVGA